MSKKLITYLIGIFLIIFVLLISGPLLVNLKRSGLETTINLTPFYLAQLGIHVFIGIILGFCDRFIYEIENSGAWRVDVGKIVIWGIPSGLVACSYLIYFGINMPWIIGRFFSYIVNSEAGQVVVAQIILGYVLITSFYKKSC